MKSERWRRALTFAVQVEENSRGAAGHRTSSGRRCRSPWQTCREPPPASLEESPPLSTDGEASLTLGSSDHGSPVAEAQTHTSLQAVDVLRVHAQELPLVVEQPHEVVCGVGLVVPRVQLLGQSEEGLWVAVEKVDLKYGLCVGQAVLLQVVIETAAWRPGKQKRADSEPTRRAKVDLPFSPEIWDPAGGADPGPGHHHHPPVAPLPDVLGHLLQGLPLLT